MRISSSSGFNIHYYLILVRMWVRKELGTLLVSEQINKHCKDRLKRNCKTNITSIYNFLVIININYNFRGSFTS